MAKTPLPLLTGGLNEVTRPDLIDDSQLQVCNNYEITGDGVLSRRTKEGVFDNNLQTAIDGIFYSVSYLSEPWHPRTNLKQDGATDMYGDYVLFIFGETVANDGTFELHMLFKTDETTWTNLINTTGVSGTDETLNGILADAGIVYLSDIGSKIEIAFATDNVFIADSANNTYMVAVDIEGILTAGISGIPAPSNKPRITQLTTWDVADWEYSSTDTRLGAPGLFQCAYTVVTKHGEESNPSPLSDTLDFQFFKLDSDLNDDRWIEKISIRGLTTPDVNEGILDTLDAFKVYMRIMRYDDDESGKALIFSEEFKIIDKLPHSGVDTGNDYTLTFEPDLLASELSYENDIAPVAKTVDFLGGITMAGNVKTKIGFLWDFQYNHPITINNQDAKNYVDAVIKIRLEESKIDNFTVSDFVTDNGQMSHADQDSTTKHFRIFDEDLTTPIMICNNSLKDEGDFNLEEGYLSLYIKIPLLMAVTSHTIYLVWTSSDSMDSFSGVPAVYNNFIDGDLSWEGNLGVHYGRVMDINYHGFPRQQVWSGMRVGSRDMVSTKIRFQEDHGRNRAQENDIQPGSMGEWGMTTEPKNISGFDWVDSSLDYIPAVGEYIPDAESIAITANRNGYMSSGWDVIPMPESGYYTFNCIHKIQEYNYAGLAVLYIVKEDGTFFSTTGAGGLSGYNEALVYDVSGSNSQTYELVLVWGGGFIYPGFSMGDSISSVQQIGDLIEFKILFSWAPKKVTIVLMKKDDIFQSYTKEFDENTAHNEMYSHGAMLGFGAGGDDRAPTGTKFGNFKVVRDTFLDADSDDDLDAIKNILNFMPAFDNMIGYKYSDNSPHNNILFGLTKQSSLKERNNMVKWTDVNNSSFPDLFFKQVREPIIKVMAAPSFLREKYQNTFIIFTRNSINRFILEGTADGWSGSAASIIEEKKHYGLLAEKSLTRAGAALFWLSETGVIMWSSNGMELISKNIVNVPIKESIIGFFSPLNNQYILHDNETKEAYVYHVDKLAWSKFTDMDIIRASNISGGAQLDNVNLLLDSNGTINQYPTSTLFQFIDSGATLAAAIEDGASTSITVSDGTLFADGEVLQIESEQLYVSDISTNTLTVIRGYNSTAAAAHGDATSINKQTNVLIQTKDLHFEKGTLRRMKSEFTKHDADSVAMTSLMTTRGLDGTGEKINESTVAAIASGQWRGIELGASRGEKLSFKIKNADTIKYIMYDLKKHEV